MKGGGCSPEARDCALIPGTASLGIVIMWIVRLALRRPYTFIVMSCLMILLGVGAMVTMPVDIFPHIDIPVVSVVWSYTGISPEEMEKRIITITERAMTTTVNDVEHIESQSYSGVSIIRL